MSRPFAIINEDGSCASEYLSVVSDQELRYLIEITLYNRLFDQRMILLQRQGRLGFYLTSTGEESTIVGSAFCLKSNDPIFLSYRELGALLIRGVPKEQILDQLFGNEDDLSKGRQMPVHYAFKEFDIPSISSPVATQLPHACGFAYAAKQKKTGQIALAYTGEGSISEGDFHMALNFSGAFKVPAVFLIRNNGYAISTPESVQTAAETLASRGIGYGVPGVQVDGNDILAVIKIVREAVERARNGLGPSLIESLTYRLGAHSSSDDPSGYRTKEEEAAWAKQDNLQRLQKHGVWRGVWSEEAAEEKTKEYEEEISALIKKAEAKPMPPLDSLFNEVYQNISPILQKQKDEYNRFLHESKSSRKGH